MLTRCLPANARSWSTHERSKRKVTSDLEHQLIFSSRRDGTSWQVFVNRIVNRGAVLLVFKAKDGSIFGGYADEEWKPVTDWYGTSSNFLYRIHQLTMDAWDGSRGSNAHYQYLCWGKQSLPNGLGMGGQFDYAGLWLDSDFLHGHSKAGPLCTTYQSPQLTPDEKFLVDEVEAFLVRPLVRDDDDMMEGAGGGVFTREQDMEFMEMAGKKMYSRDLPDPPDFRDEDKSDEEAKN
ncbi:TLD-domain-containing protein [Fennellomyces sp. T-0311]|nr:TLD-domain-containing protein [Fennellomyces sp. T-0311]